MTTNNEEVTFDYLLITVSQLNSEIILGRTDFYSVLVNGERYYFLGKIVEITQERNGQFLSFKVLFQLIKKQELS